MEMPVVVGLASVQMVQVGAEDGTGRSRRWYRSVQRMIQVGAEYGTGRCRRMVQVGAEDGTGP